MADFSRIRLALIILSLIILIFVVTRQIFDFLGRLWSPIVCNFLQIVSTIFACFGAVQLRPKFFYVCFVWTPFWIGWNVFVICFYLNVGSLDRNDGTIFNWGTNGQTWWFKNVPGCGRTYNSSLGVVVVENCVLEYYYVEIIEAAVHIVLALIVCFLAFMFLRNFKRKCHRTYGSLHRRPHPHVTVELTANGNAAADTSLDHLETSSGYLNASYEGSPANGGTLSNNAINGYLPNGHVVQNYRRHSNRRRSAAGSSSVKRKTRDRSRDKLCAPPAPPNHLTASKRSRSLQMDERDSSVSPRRRSSSTESPTVLPQRSHSEAIMIDTSSRRSSRRLSSRTESSPKLEKPHSADVHKGPSTVFSYSNEPKRREVQPPRVPAAPLPISQTDNVLYDTNNVVFRHKQAESANRNSLFSFDPKSNTLIRYHENLARSQETVLSGISSIDQLLAQNRNTNPLDIASYDSGVPPSFTAPSVETTSRNSQSYSAYVPRQFNQKLDAANILNSNYSDNIYKPQDYGSQYTKSPFILSSFPETNKSVEEESDYLQPNSVIRNSMRTFGGADSYPPASNLPSRSADTTIFESTPKEMSPCSTPRSFFDIDAFDDEGPAVPKIKDKGLLV